MYCPTLAAKYQHSELTCTLQKCHHIILISSDGVNEGPSREQTANILSFILLFRLLQLLIKKTASKGHVYTKESSAPPASSPPSIA